MKFSKPRVLTENIYPDLDLTQPNLLHKMREVVYPDQSSPYDQYLDTSIKFLKDKAKAKLNKVDVNRISSNVKRTLPFTKLCISNVNHLQIFSLVDTGASNSLIHISVINELNIPYDPISLTLATASGTDENALIGKCHLPFTIHLDNGTEVKFCTNFIVTTRLNDLQAILGAEFLLSNNKSILLNSLGMNIFCDKNEIRVPITNEPGPYSICKKSHSFSTDYSCKKCATNPSPLLTELISIENISLLESELPELHLPQIPDITYPTSNEIESVFSHSFKSELVDEKIPPSDEFFDDSQEIKFDALDKKLSIEDGDYSECPPEYLKPLKKLMNKFSDRFSSYKLDLEVTDMYTADLDTEPGKKVIQKCRRLPQHKFQFALKAVKQLEQAGVVRKSDSEWRSNVVMVPKPVSADQLRAVTKADMQSGKQNTAELYRLCLDFRDLNKILKFPKQCQFTTLDQFLYKLKNKVIVSLDISSSFFIIPIKEEDRYKTSFWVNDLAYEFNVCVMGLKSSPYHLKRFVDIVFSQEAYNTFSKELTDDEQDLLPGSFADIIISYFDDCFIFADTYEQLFAVFKLVLLAAQRAKIKFNIEKSSFFTQKIKVLGYSFDTSNTILTMDKLKASAILNMKKPASLYELHSRLSSFQYQSVFIPFLKHISYPLQLLLRKGEFRWTEIEELSWQLLKNVSTLNLRLTVPDPSDNLVLTTDASKIAASANLFREKNGNLELVATNSKFFSTTDLNKCSYVLESIALAFGFKIYSSYILNCTGTITVFTDAKSLIYAKRNSTHSILLNSTLNYITNFVSLANIEVYHIPGQVNRLADIMSRAISDNINCNLTRDHPISKKWAQVLPPLQDNFAVTRNDLFKFLTNPLKPEMQDIHDRVQKRLTEPKSVQTEYDDSLKITPEHKYYCGLRLLEQFNDEYLRSTSHLLHDPQTAYHNEISQAPLLVQEKRREILKRKVNEIVARLYDRDNDSSLAKRIIKNLEEVAIQWIRSRNQPMTRELSEKLTDSVDDLLEHFDVVDKLEIRREARKELVQNLCQIYTLETENRKPKVLFQMKSDHVYKPKICELSNGWDLPLQEDVEIQPSECVKIDLGVKIILPKHYCALLMNKSSARVKYGIQVYLGLIDVGFHNYMQTVIQNVTDKPITLKAGTAVAQLLVIKSKIPDFEIGWKELDSRDGSFGSTGQNFDKVVSSNTFDIRWKRADPLYEKIHSLIDQADPHLFNIECFYIKLNGKNADRANKLNELLDLENRLLQPSNLIFEKLPSIEVFNTEIIEDDFDEDDIPVTMNPLPPLKEREKSILLIQELCNNFKIPLTSLAELQNEDYYVRKIKQSVAEKEDKYKNFVIKNDILCKVYSIKNDSDTFLGIYIPDSILYATIIYVHKFYNHPSLTQTIKQFRSLYYHPKVKKAIKKIVDSCFICKQTRNVVNKKDDIGKQRSLQPTKPRESVSMDILYFPKSSRGYTHGLLIVDLFSMYLAFYPLKSKSSGEIAKALRSYFSAFCPPANVYSDVDPSFRSEVELLFRQYNVQHYTSYPYSQKQNTVESHVRQFKNSYRAAFKENPVFKHKEWDLLYPLVVARLNSLISKYGISREAMHFNNVTEQNLPIITDSILYEPLEKDLEATSKLFKARIGRFIARKAGNKKSYKQNSKQKYCLQELVMYRKNVPNHVFDDTFEGPARIVKLQDKGATLRKLSDNTVFSVSFDHLRKIDLDEFLTILPKDFDSEINEHFDNFRYRKFLLENPNPDTDDLPDLDQKVTRSGHAYSVSVNSLNVKYQSLCNKAEAFKKCFLTSPFKKLRSILKKKSPKTTELGVPVVKDINPEFIIEDSFAIKSHNLDRIKKFKDSCQKCTFIEDNFRAVKLFFIPDNSHRKVKFTSTTCYFV